MLHTSRPVSMSFCVIVAERGDLLHDAVAAVLSDARPARGDVRSSDSDRVPIAGRQCRDRRRGVGPRSFDQQHRAPTGEGIGCCCIPFG